MNRREAIKVIGATATLGAAQTSDPVRAAAVTRNDAAVRKMLDTQIIDAASQWRGSIPDEFGLHGAGSASGLIVTMAASFAEPSSKFHKDAALVARIREAAGFLERSQSPDGNLDLLTTNFNSPPDTAFNVHNVATGAAISKMHGGPEITEILRPFLLEAGKALTVGGIHTPNHRWVVCAALAQINELFPDANYVERIDEWLEETVDLDTDGQFTEYSTLIYNPITDRALLVMATKLGRPELLEPVRRNLIAMLYLLHADGEVVTEISHRQDQNTRGNMSGYWFPLTYMAVRDQNGQFATLARQFSMTSASLPALLEYPELSRALPASEPLPDNFEKRYPFTGIVRIRRGPLSSTMRIYNTSRFFTLHYGDAVIEGVRFASAFFGKGQFIPGLLVWSDTEKLELYQNLDAPYYQPIKKTVHAENWDQTRPLRRKTEICKLTQAAEIMEMERGFTLRIRSTGTVGVPVAVEITFRDGGTLDRTAGVYRMGRNSIKVGPIVTPHQYTQIRGAEPKLPGQTLYVTGYTPFDHTLSFECS